MNLEVVGVRVAYGRVPVLHGVDLRVAPGELVALLGTNGAGKSTLLKAISGIVPVTGGSIRFGGSELTAARPKDRIARGIVQVPGGRATFPGLTIGDNLRLAALLVPARERRARIAAVHERFGWLSDRAEVLAGRLSGGQQQILAVARALVTAPKVLLVDELSLGLAPKIVEELLGVLDDLRSSGTAIVLVEQQVDLALAVADRAYFLERGEVRFDGAAADLRGRTDLLRAVFLTGGTR